MPRVLPGYRQAIKRQWKKWLEPMDGCGRDVAKNCASVRCSNYFPGWHPRLLRKCDDHGETLTASAARVKRAFYCGSEMTWNPSRRPSCISWYLRENRWRPGARRRDLDAIKNPGLAAGVQVSHALLQTLRLLRMPAGGGAWLSARPALLSLNRAVGASAARVRSRFRHR